MFHHQVLAFLSLLLLLLPSLITALSSCGGPCKTVNDCTGKLACINQKCNDDPTVGTSMCSAGGGGGGKTPPRSGLCQQSSNTKCRGKSYPIFTCSPPVASSTPAILTNNDFSPGGKRGDPSACDKKLHANTERVVALSTGWYAGGSRCGKTIRITAQNGKSTTTAKIVDECDSTHGCDEKRDFQGPCDYNVVDASNAVWKDLGLDTAKGRAPVTWSMA